MNTMYKENKSFYSFSKTSLSLKMWWKNLEHGLSTLRFSHNLKYSWPMRCSFICSFQNKRKDRSRKTNNIFWCPIVRNISDFSYNSMDSLHRVWSRRELAPSRIEIYKTTRKDKAQKIWVESGFLLCHFQLIVEKTRSPSSSIEYCSWWEGSGLLGRLPQLHGYLVWWLLIFLRE